METKYQEIAQDLIQQIRSGTYRAWGAMEGEHVLAKRYLVSRPTIRKALGILKEQGFIHSRQGSGIYVNPQEFYQERTMFTMSDRFRQTHLDSKVLSFELEIASPELATQFNLAEDQRLFHFTRLRLLEGKPLVVEETWMPKSLFPGLNEEVLLGSIMTYMGDQGYVVSHDFKTISAIQLTHKQAKFLDKPVDALALQINHHVYFLKSILAQITIETQGDNEMNALSIRER
jgi:DNA-binding GntR family transcriptional regulator